MQLSQLIGRVIRFNKEALKSDDDFGPGQRVRVVNASVLDRDRDTAVLYVDFKEFEEANKAIAEHNYYDSDGKPTLAWHETSGYPKDCRTKVYVMLESIEKNEAMFDLDEEPGAVLRVQQRILAAFAEEGVGEMTMKAVSAKILLILKDAFPNA